MPKSELPWRTLTPLGPSERLDPDAVTQSILEAKALRGAQAAQQAREKDHRHKRKKEG